MIQPFGRYGFWLNPASTLVEPGANIACLIHMINSEDTTTRSHFDEHTLDELRLKDAPRADPLRFAERLHAAEFHWFFVQGLQAIRNDLYVPGASSLMNGIEASLRVTIAQLTTTIRVVELSPYRVLSNNLITNGQNLGIPVEALAFPGETDFLAKLASQKPNRIDVEVVRQRNNICHGDVFEYINRELGVENAFFTPECLRDLAKALVEVSNKWAEELGKFRKSKGI